MQSNEVRPWFFQIVRNSSYTWLKKKALYTELNDEEDIPDSTISAEIALIEAFDAKSLHLALSQLPAQYREILILRELEEMSYNEIAHIVEIPEGTVMSRLSRARAELRKKLLSSDQRSNHAKPR